MRDVIYERFLAAPSLAFGQRRGEDRHQKIKVSEIFRGHLSPFSTLLWGLGRLCARKDARVYKIGEWINEFER